MKKQQSRSRNLWSILAMVALMLLPVAPPPAAAAVIAYDGFDYTSGTALNTASGGSGWSNNWTASVNNIPAGGSGVINYSITSGLSMQGGGGALQTAGNAVAFSNTSTSYDNGARRRLSTTLSDGQEVWMSYLFRLDTMQSPYNDGSISLGLTDGVSAGTGNSRHLTRPVNGSSSPKGLTTVGYGANASDVAITNKILDNLGTTYLLVGKIEIDTEGTTSRTASLWVLDAAVFGSVYADAHANNIDLITEAMLNTHVPAGWRVTGTDTNAATSILPTHFQNLLYRQMTGVFDEVRFGANAWDVLPLIPEPASGLLFALCGLALLRRRRH